MHFGQSPISTEHGTAGSHNGMPYIQMGGGAPQSPPPQTYAPPQPSGPMPFPVDPGQGWQPPQQSHSYTTGHHQPPYPQERAPVYHAPSTDQVQEDLHLERMMADLIQGLRQGPSRFDVRVYSRMAGVVHYGFGLQGPAGQQLERWRLEIEHHMQYDQHPPLRSVSGSFGDEIAEAFGYSPVVGAG